MKAVISPSTIKGTIVAPASKSAMQRACAAALLSQKKVTLRNPGISNDDEAALQIIQQLGAHVQKGGETIVIENSGVQPIGDTLDCGESGLSIRMFTSIAALSSQPINIIGHGSLRTRPMDFFSEVLPQLDVAIKSDEGKLPLQINGPLQPKNITVDGSLSSQFLTGLLMAYSAAGTHDVTITVNNLTSKPYVDLTLQIINAFGLKSPVNRDYKTFHFPFAEKEEQEKATIDFTVEGDWSGAAFLLVAGAVAGNVVVKGLDVFSVQADKAVLQPLMQTGTVMSITEQNITVNKSVLQPFHFNATDCPDLFPPLVALAAYCNGTSIIEGVHRLTHKESNRALTLQQEFAKLGVEIKLQDDLMIIEGGGTIKGAEVSSHNDHRIAMACAVAALKAEGDVTITGADSVNKSYPQFWQHLAQLGVQLTTNN